MTISYSGRGGTNSADAGAANITATFSANNVAGNLNVVALGWGDTDNTFNVNSVTDSFTGQQYLAARAKTRNATATFSVQLWYAWGIRGGANTVQANFSNAATPFRRIGIAEYQSTKGSWWTNPLSTNNGATGNSTNLNSGSFTPAKDNALIVGVGGINGGTLSVAGGFSLRQTMAVDVIMEDLIQTSAASVAAQMTGTVASDWMIQGAAFLDVEAPEQYLNIPPPWLLYQIIAATKRIDLQQPTPTEANPQVVETVPVVFTANNATVQIAPQVGLAALTIVGNDAQASVAPSAGLATITFTANDATVSTAGGNTNVDAGLASMTFVANSATTQIAPHADVAAFTVNAQTPSMSIAPHAGVATWTIAANTVGAIQIAPHAGNAAFSFTANNATAVTSVVANAGVATWSMQAQSATTKISPTSNAATLSFTANNAQVSEAPHADIALFTLNALTPSIAIAPHAGNASFTFTANNAAAIIGTFATSDVATLSITANDATIKVSSLVGNAAFSFTANNPSVLTGTVVNPGVASIALTANNPTIRISTPTTTAPISFTANNAAVSTASQTNAPAGVALWTLAALDATVTTAGGSTSVNAGLAPIGFAAYNAIAGAGEVNTAWGLRL